MDDEDHPLKRVVGNKVTKPDPKIALKIWLLAKSIGISLIFSFYILFLYLAFKSKNDACTEFSWCCTWINFFQTTTVIIMLTIIYLINKKNSLNEEKKKMEEKKKINYIIVFIFFLIQVFFLNLPIRKSFFTCSRFWMLSFSSTMSNVLFSVNYGIDHKIFANKVVSILVKRMLGAFLFSIFVITVGIAIIRDEKFDYDNPICGVNCYLLNIGFSSLTLCIIILIIVSLVRDRKALVVFIVAFYVFFVLYLSRLPFRNQVFYYLNLLNGIYSSIMTNAMAISLPMDVIEKK